MNDKGYSKAIVERIEALPPDSPILVSGLSDIAPDATIWRTLGELARAGTIDRIARGIYYKPAYSERFKSKLPPDADAVARAIAAANRWFIAPVGDLALNRLGLDTQVPARFVYLSTGPYASYDIGGSHIEFKHTTSRDVVGLSETSALVVQALKALGRRDVNDKACAQIARRLTPEEKKALFDETRSSTAWVRNIAAKIYREDSIYA